MATASTIEWTESTWNPVTGCTKISPGCKHCYAERLAKRLNAMGVANYKNGFEVTLQEHMLEKPLTWKKPRKVFVNSMSDLFHDDVPVDYIARVFDVMNHSGRHQFQVLTKRAKRLFEVHSKLVWTPNIWMGVSVENNDYVNRIDLLREIPAGLKFISFEPLIGGVPDADLSGIDWAIVGGESGPGSRPLEEAWALDIQRKCEKEKTAFFFKQWGGVNKKKTGRLLKGRTWDEYPKELSFNFA